MLKFDETSAWTLLRVSEFIHKEKGITVPMICSIQSFGMLPSQLSIILSCVSTLFTSFKTLTENDKQKLDSLFIKLVPPSSFSFDFSNLVSKIIEIEAGLEEEDDNAKMLSDLSTYLNALELEKQDTAERLIEANKRIEEQGLPSGDDVIVEKVIVTSNKVRFYISCSLMYKYYFRSQKKRRQQQIP